jgi:predicted GNAT family acetyltransferase
MTASLQVTRTPGRLPSGSVSLALRRGTRHVESLSNRDRREFLHFVDADPLVNAALAARLRQVGALAPSAFGGEVLAVRDANRRLAGAAFHGGNLLPVGGGPEEWQALATALAARPCICTSIVGRAAAVEAMWRVLGPAWGPARAIRPSQTLLVLDRTAHLPAGHERVRRIRPGQLDQYLPAAAAMFAEELGVAPDTATDRGGYRRRVETLIRQGRAFGVVEPDGSVIFKADLAVLSPFTCQVHGVWVRPDRRRQGLGTSALAAVLRHALTLAPTVSLYVNDFNTAGRRTYARLGMREAATLSTILF